jgi:hypothetical protein
MSVDLQIFQGLFLNKEREKLWKTIGMFYTGRQRDHTAAFFPDES